MASSSSSVVVGANKRRRHSGNDDDGVMAITELLNDDGGVNMISSWCAIVATASSHQLRMLLSSCVAQLLATDATRHRDAVYQRLMTHAIELHAWPAVPSRWQLISATLLPACMQYCTASSLAAMESTCRRWRHISCATVTGWSHAWYWSSLYDDLNALVPYDNGNHVRTSLATGGATYRSHRIPSSWATSHRFATVPHDHVKRMQLFIPTPTIPFPSPAATAVPSPVPPLPLPIWARGITHLRLTSQGGSYYFTDLSWLRHMPLLIELRMMVEPSMMMMQTTTTTTSNGSDVDEVVPALLSLHHLRVLDLADPYTFPLPSNIARTLLRMTSLHYLRVGQWPDDVPLHLAHMIHLRVLYLHSCSLQSRYIAHPSSSSSASSLPYTLPSSLEIAVLPFTQPLPMSGLSPMANCASLRVLHFGSPHHGHAHDNPLSLLPLHLAPLAQCRHLQAIRVHDLVDYTTIPILGTLPDMTTIQLATRRPYRYTSEVISSLLPATNLTNLDLSHCIDHMIGSTQPHGVLACSLMPSLTKLNLWYCNLTDDVIARLSLPSCIDLELGCNLSLTGGQDAFLNYHMRWPRLVELGISMCYALRPDPLFTHLAAAATATAHASSSSSSSSSASTKHGDTHAPWSLRRIDLNQHKQNHHIQWSHIAQLRRSLPHVSIDTDVTAPSSASSMTYA